jgi:hypothetical protein
LVQVVSISKTTPAVEVTKTLDMSIAQPTNTASVRFKTECACVCLCETTVVTPVLKVLALTATSTPIKRKKLDFDEDSITSPPVTKKTRSTKGTHHWTIDEIVVGRKYFTEANSKDIINSSLNEKYMMNKLKEYHQKFDAIRLEISRSGNQKKFNENDPSTVILIEAIQKKFLAHLQQNIKCFQPFFL